MIGWLALVVSTALAALLLTSAEAPAQEEEIKKVAERLTQQIARSFRHDCRTRDLDTDFEARAQDIVVQFLGALPGLRKVLTTDA